MSRPRPGAPAMAPMKALLTLAAASSAPLCLGAADPYALPDQHIMLPPGPGAVPPSMLQQRQEDRVVAGLTGRERVDMPWHPGPSRFDVTVPGATTGPTVSLYEPGGPVGVSTGEVLQNRLADEDNLGRDWLFVEMYDSACPHCWYAVPIITRVATAFGGSQGLGLTTLNCNAHENREACFFLELISDAQDFPTFLLCPPTKNDERSREALIKNLSERAKGLFNHLTESDRQKFLHFLRCGHRYEEPEAQGGKEDPFLSASDVARWVTERTGVQPRYPEALLKGADFRHFRRGYDPGVPPGRPGWVTDDMEGAPGVPAFVPGQRWFDALHGYTRLLYKEYRPHRHNAIVESLEFLSRAFPVKGLALQSLASGLQRSGKKEDVMGVHSVLTEWAEAFELPNPTDAEPVKDGVPPGQQFQTCEDETCLIWTLLHVTVAAVAARGVSGSELLLDGSVVATARAQGDTKEKFPNVEECMHFVRLFVKTFLNCRQCKEDFLRDFDNCALGRCRVKDYWDLTLWLWRTHNAISLRIAKTMNAEVDRRWPMYEDCPSCWREDLVLGNVQHARRLRPEVTTDWSKEELDAPFHTDHVFWHITSTYIGLTRIRLEVKDLSPREQLQVQAVMDRDRPREEQAAANRPAHHKGFVERPPSGPTTPRPPAHATTPRPLAHETTPRPSRSTTPRQSLHATIHGAPPLPMFPAGGPGSSVVVEGPERSSMAIAAAASLLVVVVIVGVLFYLYGFFEDDSPMRSMRQVVIRQPVATSQPNGTTGEQHQDDDEDEDEMGTHSAALKDGEDPPDTDPAAE